MWLGFSSAQVEGWMRQAEFGRVRVGALPAAPDAKGPGLFVATAVTELTTGD